MTASTHAPLLLGTADIRNAIATVSTQGKALDEYIQLTALSVLNHIELHGDVTLANELYNGMPKGSRKAALVEFYLRNGKLLVNLDAGTKATHPFLFNRDGTTDLEAARAKPWYEWKPEPTVSEMVDIGALIRRTLATVNKQVAKGAKVSDAGLLDQLTALANQPAPVPAPVPAHA